MLQIQITIDTIIWVDYSHGNAQATHSTTVNPSLTITYYNQGVSELFVTVYIPPANPCLNPKTF